MVNVSFGEIERPVAGDVNASVADTVFMGGPDIPRFNRGTAMRKFC